jgi:glycosyltransferase involved in cell wall biosynthesis
VSGCRYRVLQYLPCLKGKGVEASLHFFKEPLPDKIRFYHSLGGYDLLYIHRRLFSPLEFAYVRRRANRVIFDFDDAIMYRSSSAPNPYSFSRRLKFGYLMRRVDFVVAGNEFLKSEALFYNPRVAVVPTSVDLSRYTVKDDSPVRGPMTIGWLGSSSTLKYLRTLMPTLERLYEEYPQFQLKIVCDEFLESERLPVVKKRWTSGEEAADLKSFDIGIMPLTDDPWTRGKCGLKILQYYGVGVPVVCTPVGVNRDIVEDGMNGLWAENEDQWKKKLLLLLQDPGLRRAMGIRGRKKVEEGYRLEVCGSRLYEIMEHVCREDRRA